MGTVLDWLLGGPPNPPFDKPTLRGWGEISEADVCLPTDPELSAPVHPRGTEPLRTPPAHLAYFPEHREQSKAALQGVIEQVTERQAGLTPLPSSAEGENRPSYRRPL
jgi:hypothetical protein